MGKYTLRYLPLAKQDLSEIVNYIQNNLENPIAAENTLSKIEAAILEQLESPESFAVWQSKKQRPYPYRKINVGNYTVWYVVIDHIMEVRRILYSRRDEETLI
ncbi:type II toxin-antitoxin system RelE/ParE family toxin [Treponema vincentii]|uniref:type II toxin-antitoxin system RelE/ParE family toxin n=1 Tax=Treponema vincentii TaxID=69710 RepID=UPI0020A26E08|nr:type II toxin-antitoxin system RelE/ParE family toxin [Treponema vincentii]UTC59134.1 type II toxin-antitoxin system RelE/ParE family toxin [Treponema vincentii]